MRGIGKYIARAGLALALTLTGSSVWALKCDVDNNGRIDRTDLTLIQQAGLARAPVTGPDDPRDADNNFAINSADGRICALRCTYPSCATNGAPMADAGADQTARVGQTVTLNGAASSDPDGNLLTYRWTLLTRPTGSGAALANATTVRPTFVVDRPGRYTAQLIVNDGTVDSAADTVVVDTLNSAPVANAGADQSARVGDTVTLDGRASNDVDGDTLAYRWHVVTAPAGSTAALSSTSAAQPQITIDAAGDYELELVVNDGTVDSAADRVLVSTLNSPPVARPGTNRSVALGSTVTLDGSASSDVDGNTLAFRWSLTSRPAGSTAVLSSTTVVNPSFVADRAGSYVAQLIVNDGFVDSAAASVTISTDNAAPAANAGPDQSVPLGSTVLLNGSASSDPEGAALTYAWSLVSRPNGSTAVLANATSASPSFVADRPGNYIAQLIVNDGTLASAPDQVVVSTLNSRPVADAGPAQAVDTGATVNLDGSASRDADGDTLTYAWSFTVRPAGSTAAIAPAAAARPSFVADLPGSYIAQLVVSDGTLSSTPATTTVTVTTPNRAPVAAATASPLTVNVGSAVGLSAAGSSDPDGNLITYAWSVASRPVGSNAAIVAPTAADTSFTPDVAGQYTLLLTVSDGTLSATAQVTVTANAVVTNRPPAFVTAPPTVGTIGAAYLYDADAVDPDAGDVITYSLTTAPLGMLIDPATGVIRWTPSPTQGGANAVTVRAADNRGQAGTQSFTVTVGSAPTPLQLTATLTPAIADAGQTVTLNVAVSGGNGGAVTRTATLNGVPLVLDAAGVATFAAPAAGTHRVNVTATGTPVNGVTPAPQTRELLLTVRDPSDTVAPTAAITAPATDSEVVAPINVTGTASDARLAYYQLLIRPAGAPDSAWVEIWRGLTSVTNGVLGRLDPSRYNNGVWDLGLNVVDVNGRATSTRVTIEIARERKLGAFRLSFTDISADAAGMPLTLTRTYDSLKKDQLLDFGWGWSAGATDLSVRKNMVLGLSWQLQTSGFNQCLRPVGNRRVTVTLPDGGVYRFQARNEPQCAFAVPPAVNIVFDPLPLPVGGTAGAAAGTGTLAITNLPGTVEFRGGVLFDWDALDTWNPTDYVFTGSDGTKYTMREGVGVLSMADRYGNTINYGPGGYQHNASLAVQLTRDAQGRITRATDPAGRSITYTYNAQGELASMTDRVGQVTQFLYDTATAPQTTGSSGSTNSAHLLSTIIDPRGVAVTRQQFDEFGRLAGTADGNGASTSQTFDEANNLQRVVDARGNATSYTFDAAGNITRIVDAKGGITDLTYDANGNELTRRDPLGNTVTKTYNGVTGKVLTETDPLGRTTTTAYVTGGRDFERQNPASVTDPLGRVTSYGYRSGDATVPGAVPATITEPLGRVTTIGQDAKGNLSSLNVGGITTTYAYDAQGRRTRETDGVGNVVNYTFDANGNELTRSTTRTVAGVPRVETTTRVYDNQNRVTQETDPTGAVRRMTYNAAGQLATSTDALGRVTRYEYDGNSRLVRTEFPDGTTELVGFDANGNEVSATDRQGRVTRKVYDELNRHVETEHPDGSRSRMEYDAAGRMTAEVNETGGRRVHGYDAAAQLTSTTDASGRRTEHSYDAAGNRTQTRLPDGRVIGYTYDALNRLTRTDFPDGSSHTVTYRTDNRKATETDPRGVVTTYGYDAAGRLVSVVQSGIATATAYGYDETNARTLQRDALGREVQWRYDAAGRPTSRILPDGTSETFAYDLEGQLTGHTTFGGQTITRAYDSEGREISRTIPATANTPARTITWTYNADGQRATQTETGPTSAQGTTTYTYDAQGRLTGLAGPQGTLGWTYDAADRITRRSTREGNTDYEYDGDGRLTRMVAPDGKPTTYTYDPAGRPLRSEQVLDAVAGVDLVTERRHDAQDRLIAIAHLRRQGGVSTLLAGQAISRGTGGAVSRIDTFDGTAAFVAATGSFTGNPSRVQTFGYDANARLTSERNYKGAELTAFLGNAAAPATQATTYAYDNVGNRTGRTVTTPAGTESTVYAYDSNDRLLNETLTTATGTTVTTTYTWDGNGNLASKSSPSDYTGYIFDADNRLVEVRRGATQGTATTVASYGYDGDGQRVRKSTAAGSTSFLIDPTPQWPQVVLESTPTQATIYVWGDALRQQISGAKGTAALAPAEALIPLAGHLNTTLAAIDTAGAVSESYLATAYGELEAESPLSRHQFTGEYLERDARLTYLRARWYQPSSGRFISLDPVWGRQGNPKTLSRYGYANNDPVHFTDPTGLYSLGELNASINIQLSVIQQSFALGGRQAGGAAIRQLGKIVEEGVERLIKGCLKPGASIKPGQTLSRNNDGAKAVIDFFVEMGGKVKNIEVKYQIPSGSSSGGFLRAAKQLQAMIDKGEEGLLVAYKQLKTDARAKKLLDSVSGNAGQVQVMEGFLGLGAFLGEMVIEGCIK